MPILDLNDNDTYVDIEEKDNKRVYITPEEMKTSTLFNKDHKLDTIIQYPKGSKWSVSYFLQLRDVNDTLQAPDLNLPATTQKYHRINDLILYLQTPISHDNIENISGEAIINAGFLPNANDIFIAGLAGGREAVFIITEVQNRTYNLHKAYYVTFKIYMFLDTYPELYNNILTKVMREYTYDKDHLLDYSAPIILKEDYNKKLELKDVIVDITDYYFTKFINQEKLVIALPTRSGVYVDTMLIDFMFKIVNRTDHINISKLTLLDYTPDNSLKGSTIWDVIYKRDKSILKRVIKDIGFKYTPYTRDAVLNKKMHLLGINFIANRVNEKDIHIPNDIIDYSIKPYPNNYKIPINIEYRSYVVSEEFYNLNSETYAGLLEKVLMDYLNGKILDANELDILIRQYIHWDTIDQFYLIPILMVLIKDTISHTFKSI